MRDRLSLQSENWEVEPEESWSAAALELPEELAVPSRASSFARRGRTEGVLVADLPAPGGE